MNKIMKGASYERHSLDAYLLTIVWPFDSFFLV